jgi:hypothetical protein
VRAIRAAGAGFRPLAASPRRCRCRSRHRSPLPVPLPPLSRVRQHSGRPVHANGILPPPVGVFHGL